MGFGDAGSCDVAQSWVGVRQNPTLSKCLPPGCRGEPLAEMLFWDYGACDLLPVAKERVEFIAPSLAWEVLKATGPRS